MQAVNKTIRKCLLLTKGQIVQSDIQNYISTVMIQILDTQITDSSECHTI